MGGCLSDESIIDDDNDEPVIIGGSSSNFSFHSNKEQPKNSVTAAGSSVDVHYVKNQPYDLLFKFILIGDSGVGKSSILLQFTDDYFAEKHSSTIGVDFKIRTIELDGKRIKLNIWDTAGQERFRTVAHAYFRGAHGIILVYDITRKESFLNLDHWFNEVAQYAPSNCFKMMVGNKCDIEAEREVDFASAKQFAEDKGVFFLETSAKNNHNIREAFTILSKEIKSV
eukprot:CAMPEP_0201553144 /NCGR_PEP_ID=MMETSP0173_2-20130828/19469_1 /ASSEMBLY_ACC=CAM_ASM_000268 /TAXON_ID=218659 /ORGANISM="Vexillifera sp., Strain DIVA3 564/2" /LENGTH=225 /DNA_ID=CAMNT_0047963761 /DNA_START=68 /DNA_END=742 /DNA_ORIENTATION=+